MLGALSSARIAGNCDTIVGRYVLDPLMPAAANRRPRPRPAAQRLAHPYVMFYRGLASADLGFFRQVEPGGGLRSWLRWLRSVEAERDGLAEQLEYAALFRGRGWEFFQALPGEADGVSG